MASRAMSRTASPHDQAYWSTVPISEWLRQNGVSAPSWIQRANSSAFEHPWQRLVRDPAAVEAHPVGRDHAGRRLVHVVPDAGDPGLHVARVQLAPPAARLLGREVRERRAPRPDLADVDVAALGAAQHVALQA